MTLWTEEGDLGTSKMEGGFEDCSIRSNRDFMNKILELFEGEKRLQCNCYFMNEIKERFNTALPPSS